MHKSFWNCERESSDMRKLPPASVTLAFVPSISRTMLIVLPGKITQGRFVRWIAVNS